MSKRLLLRRGLAAMMVTLMPLAAAAETVKVGLMLSYTGASANLAEQIDRSIKLFTKLNEGSLGEHRIELVRRDDTGPNPDVARRVGQELITRDGVKAILGLMFTPNANALAHLATEAKVPVMIIHTGTSATMRQSPYLSRFGFTMWQSSYPLGVWSAKNGAKRAYTAVSDYAPGYDSEAAFQKGFTEAGGKIVGSVRMPLKSPDFIPFLQRIKDEKPEVLYAFIPAGKDAMAFVAAYNTLNLNASGIQLVGPGGSFPEDELRNATAMPEGMVTVAHYSAWAERPQNKSFVAAWKKEYGPDAVPADASVAAWDAMTALYGMVKAQNGNLEPEKTMQMIKAFRNDDSPRGPMMINPETRDIVQNQYLRRYVKVDGFYQSREFETIPMVKDPWVTYNPAP